MTGIKFLGEAPLRLRPSDLGAPHRSPGRRVIAPPVDPVEIRSALLEGRSSAPARRATVSAARDARSPVA